MTGFERSRLSTRSARLVLASALVLLGLCAGIVVGVRLPTSRPWACVPDGAIPTSLILFATIVARNSLVYLLLLAGYWTLGMLSVGMLLMIGFDLGFLMGALAVNGCLARALVITLPHAVFEIPGLLVGGALGLGGLASWRGMAATQEGVRDFARVGGLGLAFLLAGALVESTLTRSLLLGIADGQ